MNPLSAADTQILGHIAAGYTNRQIASRVHYTPGSIANVVQRICEQLGAANRAQAVAIGYQLGYLGTDGHREVAS